MCLVSWTACGSPSSTLSWQCLWWSLITYSDSQGVRHPTMRVESVETVFTDPDWALLSGLSPAKQCIRYSWDKAFGTEHVDMLLLSREISSFDKGYWFSHLLGADSLVFAWVCLKICESPLDNIFPALCGMFYVWLFCFEAARQTTKGQGCDITNKWIQLHDAVFFPYRIICNTTFISSPSATCFASNYKSHPFWHFPPVVSCLCITVAWGSRSD